MVMVIVLVLVLVIVLVIVIGQRFFFMLPPLFLMLASLWFLSLCWSGLFLMLGRSFFYAGGPSVCHIPLFFMLQGVFLNAARG